MCYCADVEEGGETAFPQSRWLNKEIQTAGKQYSKCTNGGVAVKPKKGDALLFWGLKLDLKHLEAFSFHTGCPVIRGTKWSATKWIHTSSFGFQNVYRAHSSNGAAAGNVVMNVAAEYQNQNQNQQQRPCKDIVDSCPLWAKAGHCKTRFAYMVGTLESPGRCRKSCGMCCPPADVLCERRVNGLIRRASQTIA
jgi:prolyl 4-hydroxylase